jgi:hypothetical protein
MKDNFENKRYQTNALLVTGSHCLLTIGGKVTGYYNHHYDGRSGS